MFTKQTNQADCNVVLKWNEYKCMKPTIKLWLLLDIHVSRFERIHVTKVKPVYKGQPRGITTVASVDRWPLFRASETTYLSYTGQIKNGLCGLETTTRRCPCAQV